MRIQNPILRGFQPDPSIVYAEGNYYIATSTLEWFPGIQIFQSNNLAEWKLVSHPLDGKEFIDLCGVTEPGGIWAPNLSYDGDYFYLIYTNVVTCCQRFMDARNYLIRARQINGPWSKPIFLTANGYDTSLFHDDNGKKWMLSVQIDYRKDPVTSAIFIQEYSSDEQCLEGTAKEIYRGTSLGTTEAPNLYKKDGWYYLITAEGGTGYEHAVTVARCKNVDGFYETGPYQPLLTSYGKEELALQKAGHASLAVNEEGDWYMVHLCSRPVGKERRCILGRETALEKLFWKEDGWPELENGTIYPSELVELSAEEKKDYIQPENSLKEDFDKEIWDISFQTLRVPLAERASLKERPGYLRLYGGDSLQSHYEQSILAHRQQAFYTETITKMDFSPKSFFHMAGLVYFYDTLNFYYLYATKEKEGKTLNLLCSVLGQCTFPLGKGILIPEEQEIYLKLETKKETAQFFYSLDGEQYLKIGPVLDATVLSDDFYQKENLWRFTGAMIGICCQDMELRQVYADFDFFDYEEII